MVEPSPTRVVARRQIPLGCGSAFFGKLTTSKTLFRTGFVFACAGGNAFSTYYAGGPLAISVSGDSFAQIAFSETTLTPTPAPIPVVTNPQLTITSGDNQKKPRTGSSVAGGVATFAPLSVTLKDGKGAVAAHIPVSFTCNAPAQMACQLDPSGAPHGTLVVNTNRTAPQR